MTPNTNPSEMHAIKEVIETCSKNMHRIATAESCTAGLVAYLLTTVPGSSAVFKRGWVTYDNQAKIEEVAVQRMTIERYGVYSEQVAMEMAHGARMNAGVQYGIGITGVAGPNADQGVEAGSVWIAISHGTRFSLDHHIIKAHRDLVRWKTAISAITLLHAAIRTFE